jgi:uncharacterized protein GlcG (DUF336 family)
MREDENVKLARAQAIVADVIANASGPVSVWVVDGHGELVAAASMDGAPTTRGSMRSGRPTRRLGAMPARRASSPRRSEPAS